MEAQIRPPGAPAGLSSGEAAGHDRLKAGVALISTGAATSNDRHPYRAQLANASTKRSGPKVLKPVQKQPLDNGKDHRGRNAEHERSVRCLQRSQ